MKGGIFIKLTKIISKVKCHDMMTPWDKPISFDYVEDGKSVAYVELDDSQIEQLEKIGKAQGDDGFEVVTKNVKKPKAELPKTEEVKAPVEWEEMKKQFLAEAKEQTRVMLEEQTPIIRKQVKEEIIAEAKGK